MEKLLVIQARSVEDALAATPVLRAIKKQNPNLELHMFTLPEVADYLNACRFIDKLHLASSVRDGIALINLVQPNQIIDLQDDEQSRAILSGSTMDAMKPKVGFFAKLLSSFAKKKTDPVALAFEKAGVLKVVDDRQGLAYFLDNDSALLPTDLPTSHSAGYVALVLSPSKHGQLQGFANLLQDFCKKLNHPILLLGHKTEKALAESLVAIDDTKIYNAVGKFSTKEMGHLIDMSKLVVTQQNHWMAVAAALKKKIVLLAQNNKPEIEIRNWYDEMFLRQKTTAPYSVDGNSLGSGNADALVKKALEMMA